MIKITTFSLTGCASFHSLHTGQASKSNGENVSFSEGEIGLASLRRVRSNEPLASVRTKKKMSVSEHLFH